MKMMDDPHLKAMDSYSNTSQTLRCAEKHKTFEEPR